MSVESVDSPRGAVGGGTVGRDSLANRRIARWARGVLEGEADRFLFAILERGVLHRIDRRQVKEDLQNVCLPVGWGGGSCGPCVTISAPLLLFTQLVLELTSKLGIPC